MELSGWLTNSARNLDKTNGDTRSTETNGEKTETATLTWACVGSGKGPLTKRLPTETGTKHAEKLFTLCTTSEPAGSEPSPRASRGGRLGTLACARRKGAVDPRVLSSTLLADVLVATFTKGPGATTLVPRMTKWR